MFAAASLRDVINEVAQAFAREHGKGTDWAGFRFNFAGTNVLANQIRAAAKADVFISANQRWMDQVEAEGFIMPSSRKVLVSNRLVIVANQSTDWRISSPLELPSLPFRHLALADPRSVPAGLYAKDYLQRVSKQSGALAGPGSADGGPLSLWQELRSRVAPALDVRAALALVEADPSVAAIVYRSDVVKRKSVRVLAEIPPISGKPIVYSAALIQTDATAAEAVPPAETRDFFDFLSSPTAAAIFAKHGFGVVEPKAETARAVP